MGTHYEGTEQEIRALNTLIKLVRAADSVLAATNAVYLGAGLTESQFAVLESLYYLGPMAQKDLANKTLKTSGNLTMVIKNLKTRGLIQCERQASDRRLSLIQLTKEGKQLVRMIMPEHVQGVVRAMGPLSNEDLDQLGALCKRLGLGVQN